MKLFETIETFETVLFGHSFTVMKIAQWI